MRRIRSVRAAPGVGGTKCPLCLATEYQPELWIEGDDPDTGARGGRGLDEDPV